MINDQKEILIIDLAGFFTLEETLSISKAHNDLFPWVENRDYLNEELNKQKDLSLICLNYFKTISNVCLQILFKSTMERKEKIHMQIEIIKIFFNYQEDLEENIEKPFCNYVTALMEFIKAWEKSQHKILTKN